MRIEYTQLAFQQVFEEILETSDAVDALNIQMAVELHEVWVLRDYPCIVQIHPTPTECLTRVAAS